MGTLKMWETQSPSISATIAYVYTCIDFFAAPFNNIDRFTNWLNRLDSQYQEKALKSLDTLFEVLRNPIILNLWEKAILSDDKKQLRALLKEYPGMHEALKQLITQNHSESCFVIKWYEDQATKDMQRKANMRKEEINREQQLHAGKIDELNKLFNQFFKKYIHVDKNTAPKIKHMHALQKILNEKNPEPDAKLAKFKRVFQLKVNLLAYYNYSNLQRGSFNQGAHRNALYAQNAAKDLYALAKKIQDALNPTQALVLQAPARQPAQYKRQ